MMKIKPLITAMSIAAISASIGISAFAATTDSSRTLPVRTADSLPSIAKKVSLDVQENRSSSTTGSSTTDSSKVAPKSTDRMSQLIDSKKKANQVEAPAVAADNMSAQELTRKDEQSDSTDDITEGQAFAAPAMPLLSTQLIRCLLSYLPISNYKAPAMTLPSKVSKTKMAKDIPR